MGGPVFKETLAWAETYYFKTDFSVNNFVVDFIPQCDHLVYELEVELELSVRNQVGISRRVGKLIIKLAIGMSEIAW